MRLMGISKYHNAAASPTRKWEGSKERKCAIVGQTSCLAVYYYKKSNLKIIIKNKIFFYNSFILLIKCFNK